MCKCRRHVRICIKCSHVRANIALLHTILVCEFEKECTHTHTRHRIHQTCGGPHLSLSLYLCMCVHIRARIMLCVADISSYKAVVTVVYERTNSFNVFVCRFVRGRTEWLRLHGTSNHLINAVRQRRLQVKRMWPATVTNLITSTASHKRRRRRVLTSIRRRRRRICRLCHHHCSTEYQHHRRQSYHSERKICCISSSQCPA